MNRSPDRFERDLAAERSIRRGGSRDPELAADRALRDELRGLGVAPLPDPVRHRVLRVARRGSPAPWIVAAAAALTIAVAAAVVLQAPAPPTAAASRADLAELGLALNTINRTGRRAVGIAGRSVSSSLTLPELGLDELPYAGLVRATLEPARTQPEPTQENPQ
jgi:hypothetical protein